MACLLMEYPQQFSHCALFLSQDQTSGLYPRESPGYNCVTLHPDFRYRFIEEICTYTFGVVCEAPVEETAKKMA